MKKYPYQNLSIKNEKDEIWREITGHDGVYEISNYGRVKSITRLIEFYSNGRLINIYLPERVLKQRVLAGKNPKYKDNMTLTIALQNPNPQNGRRTTYVVGRLVFNAFIGDIDFSNDRLMIYHKDQDPLNNRFDNLAAVSQSARAKISYAQGKFSQLADINKYITTEMRQKAASYKSQAVTQYSMDGHIIAIHESLSEAARLTSTRTVNIRKVITGKIISTGGYLWRKGRGETIDIKEIEKRMLITKLRDCKAVTQYDLFGRRLKIFVSIASAAREVNGSRTAIRAAMNGKSKISSNSIWKEGEGPERIPVSEYKSIR